MNLDLTPAQLAHRAQVMRSYPAPFRLEMAVCLAPCLAFAVYLFSVAL